MCRLGGKPFDDLVKRSFRFVLIEIGAVAFAHAQIGQNVMGFRHHVMPGQTVAHTGKHAAVNRNDPTTRSGSPHQLGHIAADTRALQDWSDTPLLVAHLRELCLDRHRLHDGLTERLRVRATRVGGDTQLAQMARLVESAQSGKAAVQRLADRVSAVFVPVVLVLAALTLIGWLVTGHSAESAFTAAVAVLVIACPCALGLATPTALLVGTGRGAQLGILIKGPEVLESTRRVDTVVLDKTGTVTTGRMELVEAIYGLLRQILLETSNGIGLLEDQIWILRYLFNRQMTTDI